jgi:hypothetical protein
MESASKLLRGLRLFLPPLAFCALPKRRYSKAIFPRWTNWLPL